ncbi:TetR/AcrR family transcriptional regulator [Amycolatopsis sp. NPDC003865]
MTHADAAATPAVPGRRERKKAATYAALLAGARRLVLRDGVDGITIEQIAAEADIAGRTFFNYFASREEAILAPLAAGARALIAEFRSRPAAESVLQALRKAALVVLQADTAERDSVEALQLIVQAPSLTAQRLALFAAQEEALAAAIAERVAACPHPGRGAPGTRYPVLCAATVLTALRLVLQDCAGQPVGESPFMGRLRAQIGEVITELEAGLDWPGNPSQEQITG